MPPRKPVIKLFCILVIAGLALWVGGRGAIRARKLQQRLICAANIQGIGTSAKVYASSWDQSTPIIDWLVKTGQVDPNSIQCPCADRPNYIVNTALIVGMSDRPMDNRMVIACEPKSNHEGEGGNVLYADGHAEFLLVPAYDDLVRSMATDNP